MGLRINTNVAALVAQRNLEKSSAEQAKSLNRLASGNRAANSGDDAAALSITSNLEAQVRGLQQAQRNANSGASMVQLTEGNLNEVSNMLIRLRELGVQAASDTLGNDERVFISREVDAMKQEIARLAEVTQFNGRSLLNGEGGNVKIQVGAHKGEAQVIEYETRDSNIRLNQLGISGISMRDRDDAADSLADIDQAIKMVNEQRATLGAVQNRLQHTSNSLGVSIENMSEAKSRAGDTDVAEEASKLVKSSILQASGVSVLAQANTVGNVALKLLS